MGVIHAPVIIRNPAEPDREWKGEFLVDTGAIDTLVPRPQLEAIGLEPRAQRVYKMTDGARIAMDITGCEVEIMGEFVSATVVYGEPGVEPLLGVTVLQSAGIRVDPSAEALYKVPLTGCESRPRPASGAGLRQEGNREWA